MEEEIFYDGIIFRSGKQNKLFTEFKWKEWKFPSDWHFKFNRYFLSCELIPHRKNGFNLNNNIFSKLTNLSRELDYGKLIIYSGFCVGHSYYEDIGDIDDHVFYKPKNKNDVRGIELIVSSNTKTDCKNKMNMALNKINAENIINNFYGNCRTTENDKVKNTNSTINGIGVIAKHKLKKNQEIDVLTRPLVKYSKVPKKNETGYGYNIQITQGWWLLLDHSLFYYINHSCKPNARLSIEGISVTILSNTIIKSGDEITIDYSKLIYKNDEFTFICNCRNTNCRKKITGNKK